MGTSSERIFNGSGKGYLPAGTIGNRTHILSERLKAGTEFKRLKKGHRPAPMPPTWTHILSYKPHAVRLKQKTKTKRKKKIAAAIYEYQADCDGEWGEISVDFENGTAEIIRLADWDTIKTNWFAKEAIRYILSLSPDALTKYMLVPLEPPLIS